MSLPLLELRDAARAAGKRLVLCGHSLGGAVAMLSAVTLLRDSAAAGGTESSDAGGGDAGSSDSSGGGSDPQIRCVTFAAPPVANEALAAEVAAAGWDRYIANFVLPGALLGDEAVGGGAGGRSAVL
jgi:pimeloyl-ACP methyl ester carboxylesterase